MDPIDDEDLIDYSEYSMFEEEEDYDDEQTVIPRGRPQGSKRKWPVHNADESNISNEIRKKQKRVPLSQLSSYTCCIVLCLAVIPGEELERLSSFTDSLSVNELSNWVLDLLWLHGSEDFCYMVGEWKLCTTAFLLTIGMPLTTFYSIRQKYKAGVKEIDRRGKPVGKTSSKVQTASVWLHEYANKYADKLPNSTKLHLPACLTKDAIYQIMTEELEESDIVSKSHFYNIWRTCLSHIAIPPTSRFSKCNTCTKIKTQLGETKDTNQRKQLISLRQKHLTKQSNERKKYYKHAMKGRTQPDKYISIILDGMDQKKTELPHYLYLSSYVSNLWKLRTHLIGVIVHGIGNFGFFDMYQYPHGSNLTIHCLLSTLYMLKDSLPDTLYLQMDNCARENKNKYMLGFLCLLVERDIFKKIKLSFLMVGHTHEDIDQMFSRFSVRLRRSAAMTLTTLMSLFEQCTTPSPLSIETDNVYNVTEWLQDYLNPISGQSRPHVFKIFKGNNGKAEIVWKKWTTDKEYSKSTGDIDNLLNGNPLGKPDLLDPCYSKIDIDVLKRDIAKARKYFSKDDDHQWWTELFEKIENDDTDSDSTDTSGVWILDEIADAKRSSRHRDTDESEATVNVSYEEEVEEPVQLVIGKPSKKSDTVSEIKIGDLVLTDVPKYAGEWPQVGQVLSISGDTINLQWFKGSITGKWSPCTIPAKGKRGKKVDFVEDVCMSQIWKWGFTLTNSGHLKKQTRESIEAYRDF